MRRSLLGLSALGVVAALALFAWRWLAPEAESVPASRPAEPHAEPLAPPAAVPPMRAERGEETPPAALPEAAPSPAIAAARAHMKTMARLPVELSVVDRAAGTPLKEVELCVVLLRSNHGGPPTDLPQDRPIFLHGDSPLTIPAVSAEDAVQNFLVRAAGHASATVAIDFRSGGAREVRLDAACELDLLVDAPPGEERYSFELRRLDDVLVSLKYRADLSDEYARRVGRKTSTWGLARRTAAEVIERTGGDLEGNAELVGRLASLAPAAWSRAAVREEWARFDRLAPGVWIATIVAETRRDAPLAAAVVRLESGAVERRTLVPKERAQVPSAAVRGTVAFAPEWSRDAATAAPTHLVLDRAVRLIGLPAEASHRAIEQFEAAGSTRFSWSAGDLAAGLWIARLPQFGVVQEFQVSEAGPNDVAIEVGAPCEVDLALIDAQTRKSASIGQVTVWTGEGDGGSEAKRVVRDAADERFHFRAALGRLHVHVDAFDENYFITERAFDLAPGRNDLVFELQPIGRVRPCLADGAARVPWNDDFHCVVEPVEGSGGLAGWTNDGNGMTIIVAPAGRYRMRVDGVPGFEPAGPVEFDAPAGATVDVEIQLKRAK